MDVRVGPQKRRAQNWCFWTVVLEKTLENSLNCMEIRPVSPNGNQSWIFTGRTNAEAEAPVLCPLDEEWTHWKRPWCCEGLKVGEGDDRMRCLDVITDLMDMSLSMLKQLVLDREAWHAAVCGPTRNWTWLSNWTEWITFGPQIMGGNSLSWINSLVNLMDLKNPLAM